MIPKLISEDLFVSFFTRLKMKLSQQNTNENMSNRDKFLIRDAIELWQAEFSKMYINSLQKKK